MASGYTPCECPDCFEIAIADQDSSVAFCWECVEAGCDGESDCLVNPEVCDDCGCYGAESHQDDCSNA